MALRYTMTLENIHIYNSASVSKRKFERELSHIQVLYPSCHVWQRSMRSLCREWATHNALYALGIARSRTKDADLNFPQKWYTRLAYTIAGTLVWPFIK